MSSSIPFSHRIQSPEYMFDSLLRQSIQSIFLNQWVSDWIFNNLSYNPFHHSHIISSLPFNHIFSVLIQSRFQQSSTSNLFHNQYEGHQAFIPVLSKDDVTVGYYIFFPSTNMKKPNPPETVRFPSPNTARFILDHSLNQLIIIIHFSGDKGKYFTIHSLYLNNNTQHTFIVEDKQYTWCKLPSSPLTIFESSTCSPQTKGDDTPFQTYINYQYHMDQLNPSNTFMHATNISTVNPPSSSATSNSDQTGETAFEPPPSSTSPDPSSEVSQSVNNISIPQINTSCSCSLLDDDRRRFKREMTRMFHGRVTSVGTKVDSERFQIPGQREAGQLPNLHHVFHLCNDQHTRSISQKCADFYYSQVLNVSIDSIQRSQHRMNSNVSTNGNQGPNNIASR